MAGVIVDTTIIKLLIKTYIPKLTEIIEDKETGHFIGDNFINRGLSNIFANGMINKDVLLLVWDYLFLEGNIVIYKLFLALYGFLETLIFKSNKTIDAYNLIINDELKKLKIDNSNFIYDLFFKYEKNLSTIDFSDLRFNISLKVIETLEEQNIEHVKSKIKLSYSTLCDKQTNKIKLCNKDWPYCLSDTFFENVTRIINCNVFHENKINYIENFFTSYNDSDNKEDKSEKIEIKKKNINYYDILIERRPHYCKDIQKENTNNSENILNNVNEISDQKKEELNSNN